ncbi:MULTISPECIES: hypothetical protein [Pseudomonas]|uniref:Uncharacterized protein n=2 Tax=Pseudomonas syringae group TaxID=136849 RepID=A0A3M4PLS3_PSEVI|nr:MULTISPECIES: hypothetical protein [Pseudomonas]KTB69968.1 hypothetical protein AO068_15320 [Pseudomonas sp. ICMP 3272]KTC51802.1 hypothetical protein AO258_16110 [Pseudomonas syringae ICMP 19498]RMP12076.1 hypothetical protein ALQ30_00463 [Pseudomonas syringae pv. persicae]RMQ09971.1 hypothetical protein ALQ09_00546 [Pseudomonas viridiflava]RMQ79089.1 hypothetical protein ALP98_00907 [Pseudomonas viridiflava]
MSNESLDEARQSIVQMRATVEAAQIAIKLSFDECNPAYVEAKARTLKALQEAAESIASLAAQLGGVPVPVRH